MDTDTKQSVPGLGLGPSTCAAIPAQPPGPKRVPVHAGSTRNVFGAPVTQGNLVPLLRAARSNGLFSSLSAPDAEMVLSFCHFNFVEKDDRLFEAGDQADYLLFIVDGRVMLTCNTVDRQVLRVGTAGIGAILGESAITSISQRAASATTASRCVLDYLFYKDFSRLCTAHPEVALRFLIMMFDQTNGRMRAMTKQLTETAIHARSMAETTMELLSKVLFDRRTGAPRETADGTPAIERRDRNQADTDVAQVPPNAGDAISAEMFPSIFIQ